MAYTTLNTTRGFSITAFFARIGTGLVAWGEAVAEARMGPYLARIQELHAMSDAELAKIGVARGDIERHVMQGVISV